ncbi:chalcone isomerase family protein [Thiothrix subterranea]|uniref:Chalcone isomerase family protein n=1 Tax=Thiothrix subterranea TaxID=2735563 RepID=A0AA51MNQ9_9GAMM|nr:chalcone isomerase family protein [Thiothrix subterranea]MDQ5768332.1 chalcone isomerase family protein [Thiothrix subterranea]WML87859.1 chalcone isomerase family protein [Thiothrix subterranea]
MQTLLKFWLALVCLLPLVGHSADQFPAQQTFAGQNLTLNGKGVRTKAFFTLYNAGLYVQEKSTDANAILNSNLPSAMRLEITSAMITSENMESAVREGFKHSSNDPAIEPRIEQLIAVFKEAIKEGDVYDLIYTPSTLAIIKNGQPAATIAGHDFKRALFGIWLGERPVQAGLKKALLGK